MSKLPSLHYLRLHFRLPSWGTLDPALWIMIRTYLTGRLFGGLRKLIQRSHRLRTLRISGIWLAFYENYVDPESPGPIGTFGTFLERSLGNLNPEHGIPCLPRNSMLSCPGLSWRRGRGALIWETWEAEKGKTLTWCAPEEDDLPHHWYERYEIYDERERMSREYGRLMI